MSFINASSMTDEALLEYDTMMNECVPRIQTFATIAVNVWSDVLKELDKRGKVTLISGSYDDIGNALIKRNVVKPLG